MADEKVMKEAKKAYATLCQTLDSINWTYDKHDDDLIVTLGVNGDDIPMNLVMGVSPDNGLIILQSRLFTRFTADNMVKGALACAYATYNLIDGSFDLDVTEGTVTFRINASYKDSLISPELIKYMVITACETIDYYNDSIESVAQGTMEINDFFSKF